MKQLLKSLEQHGIGTRALNEDDFWRICETEGIEVIWSPEKFSFYFTLLGRKFITLPKRKRGLRLLFAMFHELGHALASPGLEVDAAFLSAAHTKDEAEADAVALVAMIPKDKIMEMAFLDDSRYGGKLWNERLRLLLLYDI